MTIPTKTRWFIPTPAKLVALLLMVEILLLLVNRYSGWLCLSAIAAFLLTLVALLVWFGVALLLRRRGRSYFQFTVITPLLLMACVAITAGWFSWKVQQAKRQREAVEAISYLAGPDSGLGPVMNDVLYDWDETGQWVGQPTHVPVRLRRLLGYDFFVRPKRVYLNSDLDTEMVAHLNCLPKLEYLELRYKQIVDAGSECDGILKELNTLLIRVEFPTEDDWKEAEELLERLKQELPNCDVQMEFVVLPGEIPEEPEDVLSDDHTTESTQE